MTIEPMLTEETPANALVARVLEEAGIEMVFGISGGHTGRIVSGLSQYQNRVRTVLVREESLGGVMAEIYGRLTRRPGPSTLTLAGSRFGTSLKDLYNPLSDFGASHSPPMAPGGR